MTKYILASASPRRSEIFSRLGFEFTVEASEAEDVIKNYYGKLTPKEKVEKLSLIKAADIADSLKPDKETQDSYMIIGADTVVAVDGEILEKPRDKEDARRMISLIQGREHEVYTGVTLIYTPKTIVRTFSEKTEVSLYPMNEAEIESYISTLEPYDKAGAYAIQGRFSAYVKKIDGDYSTVVGLPAGRLYHEIKEVYRECMTG